MDRDKNLLFIRQRINEIGSALFFSFSPNLMKLPANVVNILGVDETDQIWFFLKRPSQSISLFDQEFFTELQFYRKGANYHLNVYGKGYLVEDITEIQEFYPLSQAEISDLSEKMVLVKVMIERADYFEPMRVFEKNGWGFIKSTIDKWFHRQRPALSPLTIQTSPAA